MNKPWYKNLHRFGQVNLTESDPLHDHLPEWMDHWKETRIQGIIINCGGIVSYCQTDDPTQYKAKYLGDLDLYEKFSNAARSLGLVVIARMDINQREKAFFEDHLEWFTRDKHGEPIMKNDRYVTCVNSGYYKTYIPEVLRKYIQKYRPDGFADNSWKGLGRNRICYCDNCRERFMKDKGLSLPEAVSWEDPVYKIWVDWSYQCRLENWDLFNAVTREVDDDCLWCGMIHADPTNTVESFMDIRTLAQRSKIIFSDHQTRDALGGFEQNALNGNLFHSITGSDTIILESIAHYFRGRYTFRLTSSTDKEIHAWMNSGVAGGISPWFHHVGAGMLDKRALKITVSEFQWHEKNERYLYNRENKAVVGVVWDQDNTIYYGQDKKMERTGHPWVGFCKALSRAGIPFVPIHSKDIARYSEQINTLILPQIAVLDEEPQKAVCEFLDNGGNLILSGETACLDQKGNPLSHSRLLEKLGLRHLGKGTGIGSDGPLDWADHSSHSYLLPHETHPVFAGFEDAHVLPFGGYIHEVESTGLLKGICGYVPPFPIIPPEFSWIREETSALTAVFVGTLASGSRIIYLAADIDRCYGMGGAPDHQKLLENMVLWAAGERLSVRVESDAHINCNVYEKDGQTILHLVNLAGCDGPVGGLTYIPDIFDVKVKFTCARPPASITRTVDPGIAMYEDGYIRLDRLKEKEMLAISFDENDI